MGYTRDWKAFSRSTLSLERERPVRPSSRPAHTRRSLVHVGDAQDKARFLLKARPSRGKLTLKSTDDNVVRAPSSPSCSYSELTSTSQCDKYKTHSAVLLNRVDVLVRAHMRACMNLPEPAPTPAAPLVVASASAPALTEPQPSATPATTGGQSTGASKKKKKKGKK